MSKSLTRLPCLRNNISISKTVSVAVSSRRSYAGVATGAPRFQVFNRRAKWLQKERAASKPEESRQADYLKDEVAMRVVERLLVGTHVHLGCLSRSS